MEKCIYINISNIPFRLNLRYPKTEQFYLSFSQTPTNEAIEITVGEDAIQRYTDGTNAQTEINAQCVLIGDALLQRERIIFHGCAFVWRGKAWIFAGPSGIGKTTQYMLWKKLFADEIRIINGDRPVLDFSSKTITVGPTPWSGKEKLGGLITAPLGGIIYLQQAEKNRISRIQPKHSVQLLFGQIFFSAYNEVDIKIAAELEEKLISSTNIWLLENRGDVESAILCHDVLRRESDGEKI